MSSAKAKSDLIRERNEYRQKAMDRSNQVISLIDENWRLQNTVDRLNREAKAAGYPQLLESQHLLHETNQALVQTNEAQAAEIDRLKTELESALNQIVIAKDDASYWREKLREAMAEKEGKKS